MAAQRPTTDCACQFSLRPSRLPTLESLGVDLCSDLRPEIAAETVKPSVTSDHHQRCSVPTSKSWPLVKPHPLSDMVTRSRHLESTMYVVKGVTTKTCRPVQSSCFQCQVGRLGSRKQCMLQKVKVKKVSLESKTRPQLGCNLSHNF